MLISIDGGFMVMGANYNTSQMLWNAYPEGTIVAVTNNGHVIIGDQAVARFETEDDAKNTLRLAGFFRVAGTIWKKE